MCNLCYFKKTSWQIMLSPFFMFFMYNSKKSEHLLVTRMQLLVINFHLQNSIRCDKSIIKLFHPCLAHGKPKQRCVSLQII